MYIETLGLGYTTVMFNGVNVGEISDKSNRGTSIRTKIITYMLLSLFIMSLFYSINISAKTIPSEFTELVANSNLIAIVNVYEISSKGKSMPGSASARVVRKIIGKAESTVVKMHWHGIAITELGRWLVFLRESSDGYKATYGARSFWKIELAESDNNECCTPFVSLLPPITELNIDNKLISERLVYISGIPRKRNPIKVRGIEVNKLLEYVKKYDAEGGK